MDTFIARLKNSVLISVRIKNINKIQIECLFVINLHFTRIDLFLLFLYLNTEARINSILSNPKNKYLPIFLPNKRCQNKNKERN